MKIIVGLGNPGKQYEKTRHNIGFMAVDGLREKLKFPSFRHETKFKAEVSRGDLQEEKIVLVRPQTFMNLSGEAIQLLKQFYKVKDSDIWVLYDDIDISLGTLRIRESGSAGTHNGMKSLTQTLGSGDFPRFRLGIESRGGHAPIQQNTAGFVLESFRNEERPQVEELIKKAVSAIHMALKKGVQEAQNVFSH
ncbi:MAG: Peptidyl-tRNA hydrolase [Candidatus Peregrinibacteria bacterium GW2011_GWA2_44_7]|nr:MAG: Peptidyl-tRNA hydrolase [Candidatus Peregrinibacteria bacterium GW2011_GWA2_44_7]